MKQKVVSIGDINVANDLPFVLFGGMNVLESRDLAMRIWRALRNCDPETGYPLRVQSLF
ncbi:3-deoxy-7-phosphoheptulonate synthase [Escherichia coli]|uniref:3-deoxy-7-phosphoheptulonate synthase n=1 Tax=Escherichia coli TaxID=562 RepID=A0A376KVA2_ECOLX|nr:3-deoxy-7-phosphoheptulonate synthase [Escherichia coli]